MQSSSPGSGLSQGWGEVPKGIAIMGQRLGRKGGIGGDHTRRCRSGRPRDNGWREENVAEQIS